MRPVLATVLLSLAATAAHAGGFRLVHDDGYTDRYDSRKSLYRRETCRDRPDTVSFALDSQAIRRLKQKAKEVNFQRLPAFIDQNTDGNFITVCGPCPTSKLTIGECNCNGEGDPPVLLPLLTELRAILNGSPAISALAPSSCALY